MVERRVLEVSATGCRRENRRRSSSVASKPRSVTRARNEPTRHGAAVRRAEVERRVFGIVATVVGDFRARSSFWSLPRAANPTQTSAQRTTLRMSEM